MAPREGFDIVHFGRLHDAVFRHTVSGVASEDIDTERSTRFVCEECGCDSDAEARGWEGHLAQEQTGR